MNLVAMEMAVTGKNLALLPDTLPNLEAVDEICQNWLRIRGKLPQCTGQNPFDSLPSAPDDMLYLQREELP